MEYMQLSMDDYIQSKNEIKQELGGIVKSFVRIGWQLTRIDKSGAYKHDGYNTIAEFARTEYGMPKFRFSDQQKILQWKNTVKVNGFFYQFYPISSCSKKTATLQ